MNTKERVLKFEELTKALYSKLDESDGISNPIRSYLETEEMNKKFHSFKEKVGGGEDDVIYNELVDLVFMYHQEAFTMGIKTALSLIFQTDLQGAEE